jgi:hypothetical protein
MNGCRIESPAGAAAVSTPMRAVHAVGEPSSAGSIAMVSS